METEAPDEAMARIREMGISEVRVAFLDYNGIARARSIPIDHFADTLERGINFSSPTVDFNSRDLFPPGAAFDLASPDFWARPDLSTFRSVPSSPRVGQVFADLVDARGDPWIGCPRTALHRMVDRAAAYGLAFNAGFEPEGYIFRRADDVEFAGATGFATLAGLDLERSFMRDLLNDLGAAGIEVVQWSEEYGPGQIEINLQYARPLEAADNLTTFKETFRAVARQHGLAGTFMPKPFEDQAGAGLHVHLSATPLDSDQNVFDDPGDAELGLSTVGRHALAGLLRHGEALTALGATTVNSYKRFLPGSWAPTHIMYAYASRAAFIRIPERETSRRLELRVGDPAGNPYIFLCGILAAALDGVERQVDPGPPLPGDVGSLEPGGLARRGVKPVPATLDRALEALAADEVIREALGPTIVDELVKVKRSEWDAFRLHVGDWDRAWYLGRY